MPARIRMPQTHDNPAQEPTDEQLLAEYQRGRDAVLERLIERYRHELFNFLARFVGDRVAAEDIFQETFLQVHLSAASFDAERRFKPWLFTIAANKGRDYLRRKARRPAAAFDAKLTGDDDSQSFVDLMEADLPSPDERLTQVELQERVQAAVRDMPDHLREILLLAYFQQLSYNEVADVLKVPLGTVKSRLHTAVNTFAKLWKKQNPNDASAY